MITRPYRIFPPLPPKGRVSLNGWWAIHAQKRRRARAAGENVAPFVPPGYALRLLASSVGVSVGDSITTWPDTSGHGFDATQDTESSRPTLQEVTFGGKTFRVARFDTVDDGMVTPLTITGGDPFSIFVMWGPADLFASCAIIAGGDSNWMMGTYNDAMLCFFTNWSGWSDPEIVNTDDFFLFEVRITPGQDPSGIYINGVQTNFSPGGGSADPGPVMLGASGSNGYPGGCDAAEIIIYDRLLSDGEAAGVRAYFQEQYNYLKL